MIFTQEVRIEHCKSQFPSFQNQRTSDFTSTREIIKALHNTSIFTSHRGCMLPGFIPHLNKDHKVFKEIIYFLINSSISKSQHEYLTCFIADSGNYSVIPIQYQFTAPAHDP